MSTATLVPMPLHTTAMANVNTLAESMRRVLLARRSALLAEVASMEAELGQSPTTAEIREKWRRAQGKCKECGAEW